ncbi:hypothetical protein PV326_001321 [Microctonus aethiopoides]|nr:hypothetical protein PV326_001321 [Microctonus aethiopoides]
MANARSTMCTQKAQGINTFEITIKAPGTNMKTSIPTKSEVTYLDHCSRTPPQYGGTQTPHTWRSFVNLKESAYALPWGCTTHTGQTTPADTLTRLYITQQILPG